MVVEDGINIDVRHFQVAAKPREHVDKGISVRLLGHERTSIQLRSAASLQRT
jgi:hypothetical protein